MTTTTRSDRRPGRALTALVAALAVVLGIVLLSPSGQTQAAWSAAVDVDAPATTTGSLTLAAAGTVTGSATVTPGGTVAATWRPASVRVLANGSPLTGAQLAGSRLDYRVAATGACGTAGPVTSASTPSGAGTRFTVSTATAQTGTRTLCVTLVPSESLRASHAGVALTVETTLEATQTGTGTWTAGTTWQTTQQLPALPTVDHLGCRMSPDGHTLDLTWTWVDAASGAPSTAPVTGWRLEQRVATSDWQPTGLTMSSGARSLFLSLDTLPPEMQRTGRWHVRIVAVQPDGSTAASPSLSVTTSVHRGGSVSCA